MANVAMDLRIGILGPLEVRVGFGEPVQVVGPRLRALLIRLAMEPDRVVLAGQLIDAVWDSDPPAAATGALQSLVSRLRRLLPDVVESHAIGYRMAIDPEAVDSVQFERLALAGRDELRGDPQRARELLREALALWRGPALADVATARFAGAAVARLEELRLGAIEDRIEAELATGSGQRLVAELDELVTANPLRERLSGLLVRALARGGRQADALGAYERLRSRLADELGIDPSEELQAIHLRVLRGEAGPLPAAATGAGTARHLPEPPAAEEPRTNLRAQITSFVGRDDDIARITGVLGGSRLVTLTGPGGSGKTRLATEAAAIMLDRMPDGVWLAELGPVVDPVDLPQAVLSLFGARELGLLARQGRGPSPVPPRERIEQAIGDKRLLLVMDNCEHLVAPAAALIDALLAHCPELRVLATSREPLGITGEVLHPVGPLAMPVQDGTASEALRFPAVRLFADRGAAARPGFTVDQATVGPVLDICRALDGIPLAIELAAARLRALSPDQIAARLDDRFRLLAGGSRTSLPRHQTLRAVVDWSWGLLGEPERVLARRLAVFPGGATLEAAERVCAGPDLGGLASDDVLYLLAALVEKSLVVASDGDSGEMRYSMLETMRAYGEERRVKAGEDQALRNAHAAYFLELAEEAEPHLRRAEQLEWIERLTTERENLHGALRWAIDIPDAEMAMRLISALGWYWFLRSSRAEGAEWARQALALSGPVSPAARAQAYSTAALTALSGGQDLTRSLEYLEHAAGVLSQVPPHDPSLLHPGPAMLPIISAILRNDEVTAMEHAHRLRDNPDPWLRALARVIGGQLLINQGEARQAATEFEAGLEQFHELGERWGIGQTLFARVELSAYSADHDSVIAALQEAKEILAGLGDREDVGHIMVRSAHTRALAGDVEGARRDLEAAERIAEAVGAIEERLYNCWLRGQIERWEGNLDAARPVLESGLRESRDGIHPFGQIHSSILASLGHLELATGNLSATRGWYERAMVVALGTKDRPVMARVVELRAAVAVAEGDPERAATLLGEATTLRGLPDEADPDVARVRAAARAALGDEGYALAHQRGTARPRDQVEAALASEVMSAAGTPAAPAGRTPAR
jgi:predicted ATPase/DNA-binding SARP family transcriptional activator